MRLTQDISEDAVMTVTGELIRIDFEKHTIFLHYFPTHREIECIYLEELEDSLIKNSPMIIQVTGQSILDDHGHPTKLTDVTRIEPVDLSPLVIQEVSLSTSKLFFKTPLRLTPIMDEDTSQLFVIEYPPIGLNVFAYTREELISEITSQIAFLWEEYAKADVSELSLDAQHLQTQLLEQIEEVENATAKG